MTLRTFELNLKNSWVKTTEKNCLEICCIPLVPLGSKHVWMCSICRTCQSLSHFLRFSNWFQGLRVIFAEWSASQKGPPPPAAMQGGYQGPPQGYGGQPPQQGYGGGGYGQQAPMGYRSFSHSLLWFEVLTISGTDSSTTYATSLTTLDCCIFPIFLAIFYFLSTLLASF